MRMWLKRALGFASRMKAHNNVANTRHTTERVSCVSI